MRTTVELPDDLFRQAKMRAALQGRPLKDVVADGLKLVLQVHHEASETPSHSAPNTPAFRIPARRRGSAGAWARRFAGVARTAPGETTDDARIDHYRKKYGV